ncbi:putative arogenate dehydratase/prephenate dehydratase 6, chloroplastic [Iris pallida]|uniref:Arogenate dehydratase/prephenate dehydratase 6, chloroplastic n=1 Tax=Iris pallida TaxID=29817 RepID=A0AAX6HJE6_IRIPA|nr:putative arogenate dehydratase/prephenate dehydratase 6, chloroplastic [Iris pallida]KAJ6840654.1 putative arogenate dehydratase/prephenate dehydratase 6, chloroplastic [Iris pallida]
MARSARSLSTDVIASAKERQGTVVQSGHAVFAANSLYAPVEPWKAMRRPGVPWCFKEPLLLATTATESLDLRVGIGRGVEMFGSLKEEAMGELELKLGLEEQVECLLWRPN